MGHVELHGPSCDSPAIWLFMPACIQLRTLSVNQIQTNGVIFDSVWGWKEGWVESVRGSHIADRNVCWSEESRTTKLRKKELRQSRAESAGSTWVGSYLAQHSPGWYVKPSLISTTWESPSVSAKGGVYGITRSCSTGSPLWEPLSKSWPEEEKGHFLVGREGGDEGECHVSWPGAHHPHSGHKREHRNNEYQVASGDGVPSGRGWDRLLPKWSSQPTDNWEEHQVGWSKGSLQWVFFSVIPSL